MMQRDPLRFCSRCHMLRPADTFQAVTRSNGQTNTVCGVCVDALQQARTEEGRRRLLEKDQVNRQLAARAWSQFANYHKKKRRKG